MKFARGTTLLSRFITSLAMTAAAWVPAVTHAAPPAEVKLDYAYYSPESLVIKRQGWLEKELAPDHTQVKWVLSLGSNRALEYLNSGAIDIGSTAGLAALLGRANGNPIRAVYIYSRAEWTALDQGIKRYRAGRQVPLKTA
jgi:sulfonate transport system substrate-binding protein